MRRTLGLLAVFVLASCFGDSTGPGELRYGQLALSPSFVNPEAARLVDFDQVRIRLNRPGSTTAVLDTIVTFPAGKDTVALSFTVPVQGASEQFQLRLDLIDLPSGQVVFSAGPTLVTAQAGVSTKPPTPPFTYVGTGSNAAGVRFVTTAASVFFQDTVVMTAEAFDSNNAVIANTPIRWTSSDTTKARLPADSVGRVVARTVRGPVTITAALLTSVPPATQNLVVQPKPSALVVQAGNNQAGTVGAPLAVPITARVNAADNLGVAGVTVNFAVTGGGGSLSAASAVTNASGDASVTWTLGGTPGAQAVTATAPGVAGATVNFAATAASGAARQLVFQVQPSNVPLGQVIAPAVQVAAQDSFGNLATGFSGNVTIAIGANPGGATLGGTTTVAAVAGVATFSTLTLSAFGAGYTLAASATGLAGATSAALTVAPPATYSVWANAAGGNWSVGANWSKGTVPAATDTVLIQLPGTYTVTLDVNATVARLDVGAASGAQTLAIGANALTLAGDGAFTSAGRLDLSGGTITGPGVVDVFGAMQWTGGSLSGGGGAIRVNPGATLSIGGTANRNLSAYTLELGGTGTWTGAHTINSGSVGTLRILPGGTLDIQGDPTFNYNLGGAASMLDVQGTLRRTTSTGVASLSAQLAGTGQVQVLTGVLQAGGGGVSTGTYTVSAGASLQLTGGTHDLGLVNGAGAVVVTAGTVLAQDWQVTGSTTVSGGNLAVNAAAGATGALTLSGGTMSGAGVLTVTGAGAWTGGSFSGGGGLTRFAGALVISGTTVRSLSAHTVEVAGAGTWTGTHTLNSGSSGTLRVLSGGTLDVQGDPSFSYNLGGAPSRLVVAPGAILRRGTSTAAATVSAAVDDSGTVDVQSGTLSLDGGGGSNGTFTVAAGATLDFGGGTHNLGPASSVGGTGTARVSAGTVNAGGNWAFGGTTQVTGGALNYSAAGGSTVNLDVGGGTLGGASGGLLSVSGAMTWSGGSLSGGGGATRVLAGGTLSISGSGSGRSLSNYALELAGTGTLALVSANLNSGSSGALRVLAGGVLDVTGDFGISYNLGGAPSQVHVQGTVHRTIGTGVVSFSTSWLNDGLTVAQTGSGGLSLLGGTGGTASGQYTAEAGAQINFQGGTHTLGPGSTVDGAGTVAVAAGTVDAGGAWAVTGNTDVNGGTLNFNATGTTTNLRVSSGTMGGSGTLGVSGALTWSGGSFQNGGGTTQALGALHTISGTGVRNLAAYTLELGGSTTWSGTFTINSGSSGVLRVRPGGTLQVQGDPTFSYNLGGAPSLLDNQGGITRTTSTGALTVAAPFTNAGVLTVNTGSVAITNGGTFSGSAVIAASAMLDLAGGTLTLANNAAFSGAGLVRLSGGTLTGLAANDTVRVSAATFDLAGGTLSTGAGGVVQVRPGSALLWSGNAQLTGGGKTLVDAGATLSLTGTANRTLTSHTLENAGTATWSGTFTINTGSSAVIRNLAAFTISGDGTFSYNSGGAAPLFDNQGTLNRTTSGGAATLNVPTVNTGAVNVTTGALDLSNGGTLGGTFNLTGTLNFTAGSFTLAPNVSFTGAGFAVLNGGTLIQAAATDTARFVTLQLQTGSLGNQGVIRVSGALDWLGSASLGGAGKALVPAGGGLGISGTSNRTITNYTLENAGTAAWTGNFTINSGSGAVIRNLAGGTFDWAGDGSYLYNSGGAASSFVNQGAFRRITSTGTATVTAQVVDTTGSLFQVQTGTLLMNGANRLGGGLSVTTGAFLEQSGGTLSLRTGVTIGGGGVLRVSGGTMSVDSGGTASVQNVDLLGGTLSHEGLVVVSGGMNWSTGTISSNTAGAGGTTRIVGGGSLVISGAASKTLTGSHLLDIQPSALAFFTGTGNINTGSGAVIQNGGSFDWQGDGQVLFNSGGSATVFRNLAGGTLQRSTSANPAVSSLLLDLAGTVAMNTGGFRWTAGSSGNFGGTITGAAQTFDLGGGTFTTSANLAVTGNLLVSGGSLVFAGASRTVSVSGNFTTQGGGTLTMATSTDSLDINGNATFGGGLGTTNAGVIRVAGNFTQTGSATFQGTAQSAAIRQRTVLDGAGTQVVSWSNPVNSFFEILQYQKPNASVVQFAGNVRARVVNGMNFNSVTLTSAGGATTPRLLADTLRGVGGHSYVSPLVLEVPGRIADSGIVNVDTVVFTGSNQLITIVNPLGAGSGSYQYKSIRVAQSSGVATFQVSTTLANDLVISSGTLDIGTGITTTVTGNLRTEASGVLRMQSGTGALLVSGSGTFAGGSTSGLLTAGNLRVNGDFTQAGNGAAFAPSGSHHTTLGGSGVQNLSFANPTTSFFDAVDVSSTNTRNVVLQTNVLVNDSLVVLGGASPTDIISAGAAQRLRVNGFLRVTQQTSSPLVRPAVLELSLFPSVDSIFAAGRGVSPDTMVFLGGTTFPGGRPMRYKSVRVSTPGTMTFNSSGSFADSIAGDLVVNGSTARLNVTGSSFGVVVTGNLRTENGGTFQMTTGGVQVQVNGSADFAGGSTSGLLTNGTLSIGGSFSQGGNAAAFQAGAAHTTVFNGAGTQTVTFANPAASGASNFGNVFIGRSSGGSSLPTGITLASNIFLAGTLQDTSTSVAARDSILGAGFTVTAAGLSTGSVFTMNNALLVLNNFTTFSSSGLTFRNMNPAATFLTLNRNGAGANSVSGLNFVTVPTGGVGKYLALNQAAVGASYILTVTGGTPAVAGMIANYTRSGSTLPTLSWNTVSNP